MKTSHVASIHTVLAPMSTLMNGAARSRRMGNAIRVYHNIPSLVATPTSPIALAIRMLVEAGASVRVYENDGIYGVELKDGALVWTKRAPGKERDYVGIQVAL